MLPLLQIKNLCIAFKNDDIESVAVHNISIDIQPGEITAIVGESGSGKSVTALSILQLLPKQTAVSGEIIFNSPGPKNLLSLTGKEITAIRGKHIAMIFQEPMTSLNPVLTCGSQVMESIRLHLKMPGNKAVSKKEAQKKTRGLFEKVQLPDPQEAMGRYPHQLSGGQKQRVMIAMAMSGSPALLIADEPTTALDVTVQKNILTLIKELQQQNNMAVIFITHDLGLVNDVADQVVVMYKGEILEQGRASKVLQNPSHAYTRALLACRPAANDKWKRLPVINDFLGPASQAGISNIVTFAPDKNEPGKTVVLKVDKLNVYFGEQKKLFGKRDAIFKAVDDVSFEVRKGETVGLVGESGCGKTTLGRAILQLIRPTGGSIYLNGENILLKNAWQLRQIRKDLQIVFQDPYGSLNPRLSIGSAILEPLNVHSVLDNDKQRREKVMGLLKKVSLDPDHFNRYPHQFSGGQRQRICIARALALDPSFLIFDESVSALDVSVQAQVLNLINDLKKEFQFTSIFISHDLSVVHYICDRIMVMHQGRIVEEGDAQDIYYHPKAAYTKQLMEAIPGKGLKKDV
jgi:peptide/nickel transport system ATP-binding protein